MNKMLNIIKRNNEVTVFDKEKIVNAIVKSMKYGSGIYDEEIAIKIANEIEDFAKYSDKTLTVKKVEEMVYSKLIQHDCELTAKA